MSYIRLAQCLSSLALNWLIDWAETTDAGREFQSFTTLVLNVFLRVNELALGFLSFHGVSPRLFRAVPFQERLRVYRHASVEKLVNGDHVSSATTIVEGWHPELTQPFGVLEVSDGLNHASGPVVARVRGASGRLFRKVPRWCFHTRGTA